MSYHPPRSSRHDSPPKSGDVFDHPQVPPELLDAARGPRLHKVIADAGYASRRDAEKLIAEGRVSVNGRIITTSPVWVDPQRDTIRVDDRVLKSARQLGKTTDKIYLALYKPRGVVTTTRDELGRRSVMDLIDLPGHLPQRVYPVGRLDADSSGLLLMTNDGELANRLTHPRYEVRKQYMVAISGRLTEEDVQHLREGLILAHRRGGEINVKKAQMTRVELIGYGRDRNRNERTNLMVTLSEGQNREIRRMLARLGHKVRRLRRVSIGPLSIKGMAVGEWRLLTKAEIDALHRSAGMFGQAASQRSGRPRRSAGGPRSPRPSRFPRSSTRPPRNFRPRRGG